MKDKPTNYKEMPARQIVYRLRGLQFLSLCVRRLPETDRERGQRMLDALKTRGVPMSRIAIDISGINSRGMSAEINN